MRVIYTILLVLASQLAFGQALTDNTTATVTVDSMYVLTVGSGTTFTFGGVSDYASGVEKLNYTGVTIKCNYDWRISVRATTSVFTASGGGSLDMPCSILSVRKSGGSYTAISTSSQQLAIGTLGPTSTTSNNFNIDIKADPGYNYNGGIYSIVLQYTVTKQ